MSWRKAFARVEEGTTGTRSLLLILLTTLRLQEKKDRRALQTRQAGKKEKATVDQKERRAPPASKKGFLCRRLIQKTEEFGLEGKKRRTWKEGGVEKNGCLEKISIK